MSIGCSDTVKYQKAILTHFVANISLSRMNSVSDDFKGMSHYGINSNHKVLSNEEIRSNKNKPKSLGKLFETEKFELLVWPKQ